MLFFISQGIGSFVLLEVVNYVEHYGLVRLKRTVHDRTSYEPVKARHSWNNSASFSQLLLFKLNRHSDHHEHSNLRYHILRTVDEAPQLPCGYPAAMILALFPPLWMAIMNPRVPDINKSKELHVLFSYLNFGSLAAWCQCDLDLVHSCCTVWHPWICRQWHSGSMQIS